MKEKKYDVALSFAGEDRKYAEELAELLQSGGYSSFYDKYERSPIMGQGPLSAFGHQFTRFKHALLCNVSVSELCTYVVG